MGLPGTPTTARARDLVWGVGCRTAPGVRNRWESPKRAGLSARFGATGHPAQPARKEQRVYEAAGGVRSRARGAKSADHKGGAGNAVYVLEGQKISSSGEV